MGVIVFILPDSDVVPDTLKLFANVDNNVPNVYDKSVVFVFKLLIDVVLVEPVEETLVIWVWASEVKPPI